MNRRGAPSSIQYSVWIFNLQSSSSIFVCDSSTLDIHITPSLKPFLLPLAFCFSSSADSPRAFVEIPIILFVRESTQSLPIIGRPPRSASTPICCYTHASKLDSSHVLQSTRVDVTISSSFGFSLFFLFFLAKGKRKKTKMEKKTARRYLPGPLSLLTFLPSLPFSPLFPDTNEDIQM